MLEREAEHPFYRPLWVRICLVGVLLAWTAIEWTSGEGFWGVLTTAAAVWAIWTFFVRYEPDGTAASPGAKPAGQPAAPEARDTNDRPADPNSHDSE
ncbi:DUF3329 domain-containing protein [Jiella sp. M17.18]|uniref:DUF3329 domain-containing protein n=1 Tax=Jiella sp. M17.18 TaxID=3234247 RepID=UPI0034DF90BE